MANSNDKSKALGDDPLAWLNAGSKEEGKSNKKEASSENKKAKKNKSTKKKPSKKAESKPTPEAKEAEAPVAEEAAVASNNRLVLESSMVINKASDFHKSLNELAIEGGELEIDASQVEIIDSAIMQLLLAFVLKLKSDGINLSWHKPAEGLLDKASILGLTEKLGL